MKSILSINGSNIQNLEDFYKELIKAWGNSYPYFGKNLDGLYDILSEGGIEEIIIQNSGEFESRLKNNNQGGQTEYESLMNLFADLPDLKITYFSE